MRPAVIASVARNRKQGAQRIRLMSPQFSGKRFIVMIFVGTLIFAPGVALTVLGLSNDEEIDKMSPAHSVLYKVLGPAACGVGICILIVAILYYFCYGVADSTRSRHPSTASSGSHHHHHHHHRHSSHSSTSHSNQQDALIENEKPRHKHRSRNKKTTKEAKPTQNATKVC